MSAHAFDDIIDAVYAAAIDECDNGWSTVARLLEDVVGGVCKITVESPDASVARIAAAPSIDPARLARYARDLVRHNPYARRVTTMEAPADVVIGDDLVPFDAVEPTPYYQDWMRPQGLRHVIGTGLPTQTGDFLIVLNLLPPEAPPDSQQRAIYRRISPHLGRAARIARRIATADSGRAAAEAGLDAMPMAILMTDPRGRVRVLNRRARSLLVDNDGLVLRDGGDLSAVTPDHTARLRRLVRNAAAGDAARTGTADAVLRLPRASGRTDLRVLVTPLPARPTPAGAGLAPTTGGAALFVSDPDDPAPVSQRRIADLLGLTTAESRVAAALAAGASVAEAASDLGLAEATVRHHLRRAYLKTGTGRQADLVRLILADPLTAMGTDES